MLLRSVPVLFMLLATLLSAVNIPLLDIPVYPSIQRLALSALVFLPYLARSERRSPGLTWSWAIPLVGVSWVAAVFVYVLAVVDPDAMVARLAVLRRTSLIVSFVISALFFKEANVPMKTLMIGVLVVGMAMLILGK